MILLEILLLLTEANDHGAHKEMWRGEKSLNQECAVASKQRGLRTIVLFIREVCILTCMRGGKIEAMNC